MANPVYAFGPIGWLESVSAMVRIRASQGKVEAWIAEKLAWPWISSITSRVGGLLEVAGQRPEMLQFYLGRVQEETARREEHEAWAAGLPVR